MDFEEPEDTSPTLSPSPSCYKYSDTLSQTDINVGDWVLVKFPVDNKNANIKQRVYIGKVTQKDGPSILREHFCEKDPLQEKNWETYTFFQILKTEVTLLHTK